MKTAEEMMIEFIESEIKADGKIKMSAKKFYKIYNWYQYIQLAQEKANRIEIPDLYNGSLVTSGSAPDIIVKLTGNDSWNKIW